MSEEICIWQIENIDCGGKVEIHTLFSDEDEQLDAPICERHLEEHKKMMFLNDHGHHIKKLLDMTPEERDRVFNELREKFPDKDIKL